MAIEFEGLEEVLGRLEAIGDAEGIKAGLEKGCLEVERTAKQTAPKRDGALRRSIASRVEEDDGIRGVVYTPLFYAPYVEYGTGLFAENGGRKDVPWTYYDDKLDTYVSTYGQHPMPYMRPALDENRDKIIQYLREGLLND